MITLLKECGLFFSANGFFPTEQNFKRNENCKCMKMQQQQWKKMYLLTLWMWIGEVVHKR